MPASSSESLVHIEEKLRASFTDGANLDQQVAASSKHILLHKIDFKPAVKPYSLQLDNLKSKYIHLNPGQSHINPSTSNDSKSLQGGTMNGGKDGGEGLPSPKVVLYPEEKLRLDWRKVQRVGSGLHNMGNTCFLNSTLQCLTYTAPLVNFCLSEEHSAQCKQQGFCMMCELQRHIRRCYDNNGHAIKPQSILQKLKMIAKHMHWGRQEDAHEFLRYVVDGLQKACLNGYAKLDKFSKETTVVNQIFGGFLRSQVQCLRCKERSNTYDPVLDISLDIKNVQTVERAFEKFVQPETLDSDNAYMCPRCKQKVTAQKRMTVHKAPNVLTLQLKRFDINRMFGKISRHIQFPDKLNLRPYMSVRQGDSVMYQLYAVLVHSGSACTMGHYFCYVKSPSQIWYCMNDAMVQQVNAGRVFNAEAYLLFYIKMKGSSHTTPSKLKQSPVIGPQLPKHHQSHNHFSSMNGNQGGSSKDLGIPVQRKEPSKIVLTYEEAKKKSMNNPTSILPPEKRSKISFGIRTATTGKEAATGGVEGEGTSKPRIVMQIKHGKVTTFETSPNGKAKIMENDTKGKCNKLVPYSEDTDSDGDSRAHKGSAHSESSDRKPVNGSEDHSPHKDKSPGHAASKSENIANSSVIFDEKLNTTTSVPGNAHLLDNPRDKFSPNHQKKIQESGHSDMTSTASSNIPLKGKEGLHKTPSKSGHPPHSPSKRSDLGGLTCVTSSPITKVNSTTPWQVHCQDAVLSPSLGSTSSTGSVNSTTEWHIRDQTGTQLNTHTPKTERQCPGWTVTPEKEKKTSDTFREEGVSDKETAVSKSSDNSHSDGARTESSDTSVSSKSCTSESATAVEIHQTIRQNVEHRSDCTKPVVHKQTSSSLHSSFVDVSDKQQLLNGFVDSDEEMMVKKKHKKQKKHKKHRHKSDYQRLNESTDSHEHKSKKKKKHKHRHEKERRRSGSESPSHRSKKGKHVSDHEESPEYEWVEKTVIPPVPVTSVQEMSGQNKELSLPTKTGTVPAQNWDEGVRDVSKTNGHSHKSDSPRPKPLWDGAKSSSVVDELEKHSSMRGYGAAVCSWDGEKSHVDQAVEAEREEGRKRHWSDDYEEDIDAGKVKKQKKHQSDYVVMGYGANPFQRHQDDKNKEKGLWKHASHHSEDGHGADHHSFPGGDGDSKSLHHGEEGRVAHHHGLPRGHGDSKSSHHSEEDSGTHNHSFPGGHSDLKSSHHSAAGLHGSHSWRHQGGSGGSIPVSSLHSSSSLPRPPR